MESTSPLPPPSLSAALPTIGNADLGLENREYSASVLLAVPVVTFVSAATPVFCANSGPYAHSYPHLLC